MKSISEMGYTDWKAYKAEQERQKSHGAELIQDEAVFDAYYAIKRHCFNGSLLRVIRLYYIPHELKEEYHDAIALCGYGCIMLDKAYYKRHGVDDALLNTLFHEMIHLYCGLKKIQDTDGAKHLKAFAKACEDNGGVCYWSNDRDGYSDARLTDESMEKVKTSMEQMGGNKDACKQDKIRPI